MKSKQKQTCCNLIKRTTLLPLAAALSLACWSQVEAFSKKPIDDFDPAIFGQTPGIGSTTSLGSAALGVSADGKVVVGADGYIGFDGDGAFYFGANSLAGFRWTATGGMRTLGGSGLVFNTAVSGDGSFWVGSVINDDTATAFRDTSNDSINLGHLGTGTRSFATGISADGSVVVGGSSINTETGAVHAFRWTEAGGMVDLSTLSGSSGQYSRAYGVSGDGTVVVGISGSSSGDRAFRWTQTAGMSSLGTLNGYGASAANAASYDGSVIVGTAFTQGEGGDNPSQAFRWTNNVMTGLGYLTGGDRSGANAVSADGKVVVGWSRTTTNAMSTNAFRWTQPTGMQKVTDWLSANNVTVTPGWTLLDATGVSATGKVVVGYGENPDGVIEAWVARVGEEGNGLITDIPAFNASIAEIGNRAVQVGVSLPNLALFGAHHRSILDYNLIKGEHGLGAWVTSDVAGYDKTKIVSELLEAGASLDIGTARVGLGGGKAWAQQDLSLGGSAKHDGQYLLLEIANRFGGGVEASVLGYYGLYEADLKRNYMNGANVDTSEAKPNSNSYAVRARLDWKDAVKLSAVGFSPYVAYTWVQTNLDGYTETGGGFPATVNATRTEVSDLRYGFAAKTPLMDSLELRVALEGVQRFESGNGTSGQVVGLWDFNLPGQSTTQGWARGLVDLDYRVAKGMLVNVSANSATDGADPTWGLSLGLRAAF